MVNMSRLLNCIISKMAMVSGFLILFIMFSICTEVAMRQILNKPLMWTVEISEYLQVYITFLGAAWVLRKDGHVRLDVLLNNIGSDKRKILYCLSSVIGALTVLLISFFSGWTVYEQFNLKTPVIKALEIQKWIILMPLPIGSFFMFIEFVVKIFSADSENK
ncbi:MAG: Sialic acid TRAP transporter permease protein SiaT [Deltaproteobacteria bacterium ADurb.Bin026]|nr:hypothetical protein [Syntrophorhabdaceae bacterium]OQC50868.1 MAG: Sialic acid TRAP transporter permease protein SiaT [Deltaproteobacteria bacterium ADurb.Bin026]